MEGQFIVFYGINNLGKTTQAKKLVERLIEQGHQAEYLKYAIYNLEPSGPVLNGYLREGNPFNLSAREFQIFQALNRTQYETTLKQKLENGIIVVAEDYTGTGIAWGMGADIDKAFLEKINSHLLREDLAILFDGDRFMQGVEDGHKHETDDEFTNKVRKIHNNLGEEYGWKKINANDDIDSIHKKIWDLTQAKLK
jgi:thymidylate kinase